jgi:hypothetical protein
LGSVPAGTERSDAILARLGRRLGAQRVRVAAFLLILALYYNFVVSAGHMTTWPSHTWYYDDQAQGFLAGHWYTVLQPHPNLLQAAHPLDPANRAWWNWDYSFYQGHVHMYWGLAPAALLAFVKLLFGLRLRVGDPVLAFVFLMGRAWMGHSTLFYLAERLLRRPPRWAVWLAAWVFALANPVPFVLARPAVYEGALAGGACFGTAAVYFALRWLFSERGRRDWRPLAAASLMLGLAATCRVSLLPAAAVFLFILALAGLWNRGRVRFEPLRATCWRLWHLALPLAAPFALVAGAQFLANHLRFGSWREFGAAYQMGFPGTMSAEYILPNLWSYLFHPLHRFCSFPFIAAKYHDRPLMHMPSWIAVHGLYYEEPLAGVLSVVPFVWLLLVYCLVPLVRRYTNPRSALSLLQPEPLRWLKALLFTFTLAASGPMLWMMGYTMRYELEFMSNVLIASAWVGWALLDACSRRPNPRFFQSRISMNRALSIAANGSYIALAGSSIVIGMLYGFTSYYGHFQLYNRPFLEAAQHLLSLCPVS